MHVQLKRDKKAREVEVMLLFGNLKRYEKLNALSLYETNWKTIDI